MNKNHKKLTKIVAMALVFAFFSGLLPAGNIGTNLQSIFTTTAQAANIPEAPQATDTSVEADLPPTVIIDDSVNEELEKTDSNESVDNSDQKNLNTSQATSGETEIIVPGKYINSPYSYASNDHESINLNNGSLTYENIDYTLPGVNGLDLVIGRRYNSDSANTKDPYSVDSTSYSLYKVNYGYTAWYYPPSSDPYHGSPYKTDQKSETTDLMIYESAVKFYNDLPDGGHEVTSPDGSYVHTNYYRELVSVPSGSDSPIFITKNNNYLDWELYGLGHGWSFMFSSIRNGTYLYLADGRAFEIAITDTVGDSNLLDYTLTDLRLEKEYGKYYNGSVSSEYTLYYKDGRREYFSSDGKLIGIQDRFNNTIKFVHEKDYGYNKITITDTLNRVTTISCKEKGNSIHVMTVALPDSITLKYTCEWNYDLSFDALKKYEDPVGNATNYSYTASSGGFDLYNKSTTSTTAQTNCFVNLTTITHPTGAQTVYTYEPVTKNMGLNGLQVNYRIKTRADKIGTDTYNATTYTYSTNNCSGYPASSNPVSLPSDFSYYTTVTTDATGVSTTVTFGNKHQKTKSETKHGDLKIQDEICEYNADKLPTKVTTNTYNDTDQKFIQSISAMLYDNKGNITASWSPMANGDTTNTEYKTTYNYDPTYNLLVSKKYKQDASTNIELRYTLDSSKVKVVREEVYVNDIRTKMTEYDYDSYGNIYNIRRYKDGFTEYYLTQNTYNNSAYLSSVTNAGILNADGSAAAGSPGSAAGTVVSRYQYDNLGRLIQSTDGNGNVTKFAYNNKGDLTTQTNPDNTTKIFDKNYTSNYVTVTDENGAKIKHTYTALGLEFEAIDVQTNSVMTRREYDSSSRLIKVSDFVKGSVTEYTYDYNSRVLSEVVKDGTTVLSNKTYTYSDAVENGTLQKITTTIVGDVDSPSIVTTQYSDKMGCIIKKGKILGGVEYFDSYTYDYLGNALTERLAYGDQLKLTYTTKNEYDYAGRVIKSYNAEGHYSTVTYDALGNMVSSTDYAGTTTSFAYDALGRKLIQKSLVDQSQNNTSYANIKYYYDASGNITSNQASNNAIGLAETFSKTLFDYDSRGNLAYVTVYDGENVDSVTKYTYDGVGKILTMRTGMSAKTSSDGATTAYTYDRFGNTLTITDPLGQTESYQFTQLGKPVSKTDRNGNVTTYSYDGLGRLLSSSVTSGDVTEIVNNQYTLTGTQKSVTNGTATFGYKYDELGRVVRTDETGVAKQYSYDLANNTTSFTLTVDGKAAENTTYTYDPLNRLKTVSEGGVLQATYVYDINGNRSSMTYANGSSETYTYNKANWVTSVTNNSSSSVVSSYSYTYYANGNQKTKTDMSGKATSYVYDGAGRLKSESESGGLSLSYQYDRNGNRTSLTASGSGSYETSYTYDANNRLIAETKTTSVKKETSKYYYDPNGNQISKVNESLVTSSSEEQYLLTPGIVGSEKNKYNGFNQLIETCGDGGSATYTYNPSGLRSSKIVNGTETKFIYNGENVVLETVSGELSGKYVRGINLVCSTISGKTSYYLYNAHGDVVQLASATGAVTKSYNYDAFGNEKAPDKNDINPFRYCGEYYDLETNTYYLRARNYNPTTGRFLSEDTYKGEATDLLSLNLYTYCKGDPVNYCDPSGHWQESDRNLPDWAESLIFIDTKQWYIAQANNDRAGMDRAHEHAQAIRRFAARKNTYNMMQFFGVTDPTKIQLPDNAMVFLENTKSVSIGNGFSVIEGHSIVMDFDKYCEYGFGGIGYGPSGVPVGDICVTKGYVYNVKNPEDFAGFFYGGGGSYSGQSNGGAVATNGVYSKILGGESLLAGSTGGSITYYKQIQRSWTYGKAKIKWYNSSKSSYSNNSI